METKAEREARIRKTMQRYNDGTMLRNVLAQGEAAANDIKVKVQWREASEPGALDSFDIHCSKCGGVVGGSSMRSSAGIQARKHREWHMSQEG